MSIEIIDESAWNDDTRFSPDVGRVLVRIQREGTAYWLFAFGRRSNNAFRWHCADLASIVTVISDVLAFDIARMRESEIMIAIAYAENSGVPELSRHAIQRALTKRPIEIRAARERAGDTRTADDWTDL